MKQYKIQILPAAYADIEEARDWYRNKNSQLPKRLLQQLKITLGHIRSVPTAHAIR